MLSAIAGNDEIEQGDVGSNMLSSSLRDGFDGVSFTENDDEVELQWAAIERLPAMERLRTSLFDQKFLNSCKEQEGNRMKHVDVTKLGALERQVFVEKLITKIKQDNLQLLKKIRERIDSVGVELPTIEVRFKNLSLEVECEVVQWKPLPTLWNTVRSMLSAIIDVGRCKSQHQLKILKDVSGILKPSRITLLLGPPGCGKTTLLKALAGKLNPSLKVMGEISYNGYDFTEFVPQKTSAYISQYDLHISEMTVRETLDFSAYCQGVGTRADILKEVSRREKQQGIIPEPDIDTYMKAISVEGLKRTLQTDYILKILGLDICADTIVGDAMTRGISGGEKRRLTTGEMVIGPAKALFMDEISTGLDSSTTFQIVTCLQQFTHIAGGMILVSLLQPAPETFDLFDDIVLMAEGKIVYNGPRDTIQEFFEYCGFRCPPRKSVADFIQEVISEKDQAQYWYPADRPHSYVSADKFIAAFKEFHVGQKLDEELSSAFNKSEAHKSALSFNFFSIGKWQLFKACMSREWLLMKRNSFIYAFQTLQMIIVALITMTIFIRNQMKIDMVHVNYYMGALFYALIRLVSNGVGEFAMTLYRLPVFHKQKDLYFYPPWAYTIPTTILKIPYSFLDSFLWTALTYYTIGYSPEPQRFFRHLFILFLVHQVSISLFRVIAAVFQNAATGVYSGQFLVLLFFFFGGTVITRSSLPSLIQWAFWISPVSYAEIGVSVNEFLAPRWQKVSSSTEPLGHHVLKLHGLDFGEYFYWISVGALIGFWVLINITFTLVLSYLESPGRSRATISQERFSYLKGKEDLSNDIQEKELPYADVPRAVSGSKITGMVLPFEPATISFENVQYFVDTPKKLREHGFPEKKLQLLEDINGAFRPGVLTALMGASGAGKTTMMDVLSGRKTSGYIEGEIKIGGYPKVQETYARISGYCEQIDVHSPQITVEESVMFSAWLRLPQEVDKEKRLEFVAEVIGMIEMDDIKDALVGIPGESGISPEQRKRLTIAVELVANPSIIFMDEPTSGLDARAAAIVMRVVKNIVSTKRTIVCTIHQPSTDIFEAFDELILMKRGGQMIYSGAVGRQSSRLIEYFEAIPGVPKIKENQNPAAWMLEVTSPSAEALLGVDFAHIYKQSHLFRENKKLVKELSVPANDCKELHFSTQFPQNGWEQFKACLWKQQMSYWRSPIYNLGRFMFSIGCSMLYAALLWQKGQKIENEQDIINIIGALYLFMVFAGVSNCVSILRPASIDRTIFFRERFSRMYSSFAYSLAQVAIEIPYVFLDALLFMGITYGAVNFYPSAYKTFWYFYAMFCTVLYYKYLGLMLLSLTPTYQLAAVLANFSFTLLNLFTGYLLPGPKMPKWWAWFYKICPTAWTLKAFLASQYGDIKQEITAFGEPKPINAFLESQFGFKHEELPVTAILLLSYPILFAIVYAYCMGKLNFQNR